MSRTHHAHTIAPITGRGGYLGFCGPGHWSEDCHRTRKHHRPTTPTPGTRRTARSNDTKPEGLIGENRGPGSAPRTGNLRASFRRQRVTARQKPGVMASCVGTASAIHAGIAHRKASAAGTRFHPRTVLWNGARLDFTYGCVGQHDGISWATRNQPA